MEKNNITCVSDVLKPLKMRYKNMMILKLQSLYFGFMNAKTDALKESSYLSSVAYSQKILDSRLGNPSSTEEYKQYAKKMFEKDKDEYLIRSQLKLLFGQLGYDATQSPYSKNNYKITESYEYKFATKNFGKCDSIKLTSKIGRVSKQRTDTLFGLLEKDILEIVGSKKIEKIFIISEMVSEFKIRLEIQCEHTVIKLNIFNLFDEVSLSSTPQMNKSLSKIYRIERI